MAPIRVIVAAHRDDDPSRNVYDLLYQIAVRPVSDPEHSAGVDHSCPRSDTGGVA